MTKELLKRNLNTNLAEVIEPDCDDLGVCDEVIVHEQAVKNVKSVMPKDEMLYDLADLFKVLGDFTRIRILFALSEGEMCVCDIAELLGMTQSAISHQLRVLKQARLVKFRKEGKEAYYTLDDEHVSKIFDCGLDHIKETYR